MCAVKWPSNTRKYKATCLRQCLAALAQIESGTQAGQLDVEAEVRLMLARFSDRVLEKGKSVDWLIALSADKEAASQSNKHFANRMLGNCGGILLGMVNSRYCVAPSLEQYKRGSGLLISYAIECTTALPGETRCATWCGVYGASFTAHFNFTICYTLPQRMNDSSSCLLGEGGSKVVACRAQYPFEQFHPEQIARSGYDPFVDQAYKFILQVRFADMVQMAAAIKDWEASNAKMKS